MADDIRRLEGIGCHVAIVGISSRPAHDLGWVWVVRVGIWEKVPVVHAIDNNVGDMTVSCHGHSHVNGCAYQVYRPVRFAYSLKLGNE